MHTYTAGGPEMKNEDDVMTSQTQEEQQMPDECITPRDNQQQTPEPERMQISPDVISSVDAHDGHHSDVARECTRAEQPDSQNAHVAATVTPSDGSPTPTMAVSPMQVTQEAVVKPMTQAAAASQPLSIQMKSSQPPKTPGIVKLVYISMVIGETEALLNY